MLCFDFGAPIKTNIFLLTHPISPNNWTPINVPLNAFCQKIITTASAKNSLL